MMNLNQINYAGPNTGPWVKKEGKRNETRCAWVWNSFFSSFFLPAGYDLDKRFLVKMLGCNSPENREERKQEF